MVSGSLLDAAEERLPTTPGTCVLRQFRQSAAASPTAGRDSLSQARAQQSPSPTKATKSHMPKNRQSCIRGEATRSICV